MISTIQPSMMAATSPLGGGAAIPDNVRQLGKSLRNDDLQGAKQAFADIVRTAPEGASWPKGSAFASLGRALATGDLAAAKQSFAEALRSRLDVVKTPGEPVVAPLNTTGPSPAAAGGLAGGTIHVVA